MANRNITLTLPAELIKKAKIAAAHRDTSVSALIAELLRSLVVTEDDYPVLWQDERRLMVEGLSMQVGKATWSRDEVHER